MAERHLEVRRSWYADPSTEIVQQPRAVASAVASTVPELTSVKRLRPSRRSSNGLPSRSPAHRLSEAATRPPPAVAIVIAERVAGSPPTDPLDHEHRVTLPHPILALGPSTKTEPPGRTGSRSRCSCSGTSSRPERRPVTGFCGGDKAVSRIRRGHDMRDVSFRAQRRSVARVLRVPLPPRMQEPQTTQRERAVHWERASGRSGGSYRVRGP